MKTEKDGLCDPLVCWNFSSLQRSKLDKGGADRPPRLRRSLLRQQRWGKCGGWARHEAELSTMEGSSLGCCPCFGEFVAFEVLAEERDSERTRGKRRAEKDACLQSNDECFYNAVCGDIARKTSSPKGHRRLPRTGKLLERLEAVQQHNRLAEQL